MGQFAFKMSIYNQILQMIELILLSHFTNDCINVTPPVRTGVKAFFSALRKLCLFLHEMCTIRRMLVIIVDVTNMTRQCHTYTPVTTSTFRVTT